MNVYHPQRLVGLFLAFVALSLTVLIRLLAIEVQDGDGYRAAGAEPIVRQHETPALRGRILARNGAVLARDEPSVALAVDYRWLEQPANSRWLRQTARARLTPAERRNADRLQAAENEVLDARRELARRLARLCGLSEDQWRRRTLRIQQQVEAISAKVNARHAVIDRASDEALSGNDNVDGERAGAGMFSLIGDGIVKALFRHADPPRSAPITVVEEVSAHVVHEGLPIEVVAEIEAHPARYPGVELVRTHQRVYPAGESAANIVGYLSEGQAASAPGRRPTAAWSGTAGIEGLLEARLRATPGVAIEHLDVRGQVRQRFVERAAKSGGDVMVTIDPIAQRAAEQLLDEACRRRILDDNPQLRQAAGAAAVVIDLRGELLVAATAPRFDPNAFIRQESDHIAAWLRDPAAPLFDRSMQMALPPGSVFKIITAAAILDAGVNPNRAVDCQGYLHQPEALRCAIFRHLGVGHGPMTLPDALARSCNVYFFHHADQLGTAHLVDWARRFGLGGESGARLAGESAGRVPNPVDQTDAKPISIGQGELTTTPLQMARVAAAIANGGRLVRPRILAHVDAAAHVSADPWGESIAGLTPASIAAIRDGLRQTVADEQGTAHATVHLQEVAIAGKTGTAQTGEGRPDHAWFVGYAPADRPQLAFAIVVEYGGDGAIAAGPVAKQLVLVLNQLGYLSGDAGRGEPTATR